MLTPGPSRLELENVAGSAAWAVPFEGFEIYPEPIGVWPENAGGHKLQPIGWWRIFQNPSVIDSLLFRSRANHEPRRLLTSLYRVFVGGVAVSTIQASWTSQLILAGGAPPKSRVNIALA